MKGVGGSLGAGPIWRSTISSFMKNTKVEQFKVPAGVIQTSVCNSTSSQQEYFIRGTESQFKCAEKPKDEKKEDPKKREEEKKPEKTENSKPSSSGTTDETDGDEEEETPTEPPDEEEPTDPTDPTEPVTPPPTTTTP
jgi:membrane carboxypeptidase/penicillin-binding protein